MIAIVAGTVFSAISGSTIATTALLGSLMLPTMLDRGYDKRLAMGPIIGIGGVDMLIPPSALAVLLGSLAGISISGLLIGGIVPGLILSVLFVGYIVLRAWLDPSLAPEERLDAGPAGLRALAAVPRPCAAAGPDLRHGGRRDDRGLGDADRGRGARRRRHHRRRDALPQPDLGGADEGADRHGRGVRHHPVHHHRRHHVLAGAELLRRHQRHRRPGLGAGAVRHRHHHRHDGDPVCSSAASSIRCR